GEEHKAFLNNIYKFKKQYKVILILFLCWIAGILSLSEGVIEAGQKKRYWPGQYLTRTRPGE
uniref:hypothetical protein n=1 Tax=Klebsiella pneumoniae TaxID=573 RepID=UPI0024DED91D